MTTLDILLRRLDETRVHHNARKAWMVEAQKEMTRTLDELAEDEHEMADLSRAIDALTAARFDVTVLP